MEILTTNCCNCGVGDGEDPGDLLWLMRLPLVTSPLIHRSMARASSVLFILSPLQETWR